MKNSRLAILTALALTLASGVGYADSNDIEVFKNPDGSYIVMNNGVVIGTAKSDGSMNLNGAYQQRKDKYQIIPIIRKKIKEQELSDDSNYQVSQQSNPQSQKTNKENSSSKSVEGNDIKVELKETSEKGVYKVVINGKESGTATVSRVGDETEIVKSYYAPSSKACPEIEKQINNLASSLPDEKVISKSIKKNDDSGDTSESQAVTTNGTKKDTVASADTNTNNATNGKSILLDNDGTFFDGPNTNPKTHTSADVGAGIGNFFRDLKNYNVNEKPEKPEKNPIINASTTETKNIKNEASEKPNSEKKAINKDDCEYTTAEEGQELDQIFRKKFGDPKDNPEAYELFKQLNPKYVAPGEKVYFPPTDAIAELKKTNSGNDVAKKQDTETANSIDKSKCKSVKAQSGQQMVDIFKKEFGDPKDNPDAYKLFQQLNPEFVAPDALVYFPTKEAIEAEKEKSKKSKETKDATAAKDDKSKKDAKNKEAEIKAEIEKINKKLDDNTKKAISGLEKNNKDAYDKIVKDPKEYKRIAELIKNNPNEYIKEVYQTGNSNRTPSLEYFDKSLANLKKTNSSKYSELRAQYEKDLAVAIEGGQGYHNGSYFEVTNLVIVDVYGNKKKVSYSADGKRVETSN